MGRRLPSPRPTMVCGRLRVHAWLSALAEACWGAGQGPELRAKLHRSSGYSSKHVPGPLCDRAPQVGARRLVQLAFLGAVAAVVVARVYPVSESLNLPT